MEYYDVARKYFIFSAISSGALTLFIDAPFGRFTPSNTSIFLVNGIKSWMLMEIVSPVTFIASFLKFGSFAAATSPQILLAAAYLIHYANRAIISPLRTPSRSKAHIMVPAFGISYNIVNGFLMGSYLSSQSARKFLGTSITSRPAFVVGLALWALGFAGNILHDEILLNIRRKANLVKKEDDKGQEHYAIPQGWLYKYISYPNYFCEWIEWAGFALAAAPIPTTLLTPAYLFHAFNAPASRFAPTLSPPYIFLLTEILAMTPRAIRGHIWYQRKFGAAYPKERNAVIPFVL